MQDDDSGAAESSESESDSEDSSKSDGEDSSESGASTNDCEGLGEVYEEEGSKGSSDFGEVETMADV